MKINEKNQNKYVSGDWPLSTHADPTRGQRASRINQRMGHARGPRAGQLASARAICQVLGFWGSKVPQNVWFPVLDADEPLCKIWRH